MFKKIIIGIVVIAAIGAYVSKGGDKTTTPTTAPAPSSSSTSTPAPAPKEAPMVITADKLMEDLKGNALNASNSYKDKYVEVTGKLSNIDSAGKYFGITPANNDYAIVGVQCYITKDQKDAVAKLTKGQKLTVTGKITDVGEVLGYTLKVESIK